MRVAPFVLLVALVLAGCGRQDEGGISGGGKVLGRTITVYSLMPDPVGRNRDFVDGEKLALADAGGRAGSLLVNFNSLDLGTDESDEAEAVRRAVTDPQIIAAVVECDSGDGAAVQCGGGVAGRAGWGLRVGADPNATPLGRPTVGRPATARCRPTSTRASASAFGRAPGAGAEDGYRAMAGVLRAIATPLPGMTGRLSSTRTVARLRARAGTGLATCADRQ